MDPTNFQALYMAGSAYACAVGTRTPFRYRYGGMTVLVSVTHRLACG